MLVRLRRKAQVTIPKEIVARLGLSEGDTLDVFETDGSIRMVPVSLYPEHDLTALQEEVDGVKAMLASGEQPTFDRIDTLLKKLEAN